MKSGNKIIFFLLCLEGALVSLNLAAIPAVVPKISLDLGIDNFLGAKVISWYMVPYGLGALIYAPLVKKISIKNIKIICLSVFSIFSFVSGISSSFKILALSRIFAGIAAASTIPIALILIGQLFTTDTRGRFVGMFFSATFISSFVGVLLSGFLNWRYLFIIPAIIALISFLLVVKYFNPEEQKYNFEVNYTHLLRNKKILVIFSYIFVLSFIYHGAYNWLGVYFNSLNMDQLKVSFLLSLVGFSGIFGQLIGGFLTDKKGRKFSASLGLLILGLSTALLAKSFSFFYLFLVLLGFGIGWTINHNAVSTVLTDFPEKFRPEIASFNSSVRFFSGGVGVGIAGIFMKMNFQLTYLFLGIILVFLSMFTKRILSEDI
ncbi:MAG: MFS transporter [Candidatus Omnitrophota bacterium]